MIVHDCSDGQAFARNDAIKIIVSIMKKYAHINNKINQNMKTNNMEMKCWTEVTTCTGYRYTFNKGLLRRDTGVHLQTNPLDPSVERQEWRFRRFASISLQTIL